MWDLPPEYAENETYTRRIQNLWRYGYVDIVQTDGSPKLSSYLAKYMRKAMHDKRLMGKKAYSASRNILRPVSFNTQPAVDFACEAWGIGPDTKPNMEREYYTPYLGTCRYRAYFSDGDTIEP